MRNFRTFCPLVLALLALLPAPAGLAGPKLQLSLKNVVFDIGDVLIPLNNAEFLKRMAAVVGPTDAKDYRAIVEKFETGKLTASGFGDAIRALRPGHEKLSDAEIEAIWNTQLGPANCDALKMIRDLRARGIRTYVASTTNPIGAKHIEQRFKACFPGESKNIFSILFDKVYFTHEIGMLKPDPAVFRKIAADARISTGETLFLDDSPENVLGAQQAGMFSLLVTGPAYIQWVPRVTGSK